MLLVFILTCLCALGEFSVEAILRVQFEDLKIKQMDPEYLDPENTKAYIVEDFDEGETTITTNLEIIKSPPEDTETHFTLTGLSMGQYTLATGIDMNMKLCDTLNEPIIMGPFFQVLGFDADNCPPPPGNYSKPEYKLPVEMLPDEYPDNRYLVYFDITIKGKPVIAVEIYANIQTTV